MRMMKANQTQALMAAALCFLFSAVALAGSVSITRTAVTDTSGVARSFFSSTERINLRIESYCSASYDSRIFYRFYIFNPSGAQVFLHDSNSTEGNVGAGASALRNIPMNFYSGPGLYRFRAELVVDSIVQAFDESKSFTIYSPIITLTYPYDGVTELMDKPVTFRWVASGAPKYRVSVADERSFYNPLWTLETPASYAQYPLNPPEDRQKLAGGTQYFWKVEGVSSDGRRVASSDIYSFTLQREAASVSYRNLAITGLEYDPLSTPPEKVIVKAEVSNMGNQSESAAKVNLFVGGVLSGFTQLGTLMPSGKAAAVFEFGPVLQENIIVTAMLEFSDDNPKDNVMTKSFSVNLPEEWRNVPKIIGRVVERGTENGIPGIKLTLEGPVQRNTVSGPGGQYKFEKLSKGQYKISPDGEGIEGESINVNVSEDKAYTGNNISVSAAADLPESDQEQGTAVVKGQALVGAEKSPLEGALVKLMRKAPGGEYRAESETKSVAKGFYRITGVRSGSYKIVFEKEGYASVINEIEVKKGAVVISDCVLTEQARSETGAPAEYSPDEAWGIIRAGIKDRAVLSALEGYKASDLSISGGSLKDALDAIKSGKLKIRNADLEIVR